MTASKKKIKRILALHFGESWTPIKIYKKTGIPLDTVKMVIKGDAK
jgi:hypothetical protein